MANFVEKLDYFRNIILAATFSNFEAILTIRTEFSSVQILKHFPQSNMASKFVLPQLALARRQMSGMAIKKIDGPISHHVEVSKL